MATTSLALCARGGVSCGWRENAALGAAMRKYVVNGLFGGIVCASNNAYFSKADKNLITKGSYDDKSL